MDKNVKKKEIAKKMNHKEVAKYLELPHGNPKYHKAMNTYLGMKSQDRDLVIKANKHK